MTSHAIRRMIAMTAALLILGVVLGARAPRKPKAPVDRHLAPEINLTRWINTTPLTPADLTGTPRLVEFWTFGCANCRNTVMAMREIHGLYAKRGLRVMGIHAPEFAHERDSAAVAAAVKSHGITFPVGLDNEHAVFDAFKNRHWPALYLIDRRGEIRSTHIGELHVGTRAWINFCAAIESTLASPPLKRRT